MKTPQNDTEASVTDSAPGLSAGEYRHLWATYAHSPIATLVLSEEGAIVDCNDAMEALTGYAHCEVPDVAAWMRKIYPDESYRNRVARISAESRSRQITVVRDVFAITTKTGIARDIEFSVFDLPRGKPGEGLQLVQAVDVTEAVQAVAALRTSEERFRTLIDSLGEGIYFSRNGILTQVNPAMCSIFGRTQEELVGTPAWELARPELQESVKREMFGMVRTGNYHPVEVECLKRDGTVVHAEVRVSGKTEDGGVFGLVMDTTERHKLERALLDSGDRERISIGYNLHDDLGQLLTGMKMLCHVLHEKLRREGHESESTAREISDLANESICKTRELVKGLDIVEPLEEGLSVALRALAKRLDAQMVNTEVRFTKKGRAGVCNNRTAGHLYRVVQEATNNAARHAEAKTIHIRMETADHSVSVAVEDDGKGLQDSGAEMQGMGLRIMEFRAREIAGILCIDSAPGKGTTVRCSCPN